MLVFVEGQKNKNKKNKKTKNKKTESPEEGRKRARRCRDAKFGI